jgi:cytochrome P450
MAQLNPVPYRAFHSLSQAFGPIVRTVLGLNSLVVFSRYEDIKEVFNNEELDDRIPNSVGNLIIFGDNTSPALSFFGNTFAVSKIDTRVRWRELRRFMLKSLRDLGFAKTGSEQAILEESTVLVRNINKRIEEMRGHVSLDKVLNSAALNIVWNLIAAERFDYDDQKMLQLIDYVGNFMLLGKDVIGKPLGAMPFLRFFPPYRSLFDRLSSGMNEFKDYISSAVATRKGLYDSKDPACFIDMYLNRAAEDETGIFTEKQLVHNCMDLFLAGSETTSKSLQYAIACLILHPEVQDKVQEELDRVADGRQQVTMADKPRLPYVEATLNEVWRYCNVAPFGPPRKVRKELEVEGGKYAIPAGTAILYNTYTLHMDEAHWGDPQRFRPERFLTNQGAFCPDEMTFPFGIGRRRCLGESLARMENFLFFSNLLLNFRFRQGENPPPRLEPEAGFTNGPYPFSMEITARL